MSVTDDIEVGVEEVLHTSTVEKAREIVQSRSGTSLLALVSFFESALPIPILTDPFLIAAILLDRTKVKAYILVTTITSALGGAVAYYMAYFFIDTLLGFMPLSIVTEFNTIVNGAAVSTMVLTILGAITPVPYTAVAWAIAVLHGSILVLIIGSLLGRGFRYAVVGYCAYRFGPQAVAYAKRYIGIASIFVVLAVVVYFLLKM